MTEHAVSATSPEAGICLLRLDRPARMNAMSLPALQAFHAVLDQVLADRSLRAIVLTGEGSGFCAGLDLKSVLDADGGFLWPVAQAMGLASAGDIPAPIRDMNARIGLPQGLAELGVTPAMFPKVIDGALADHCHKTNPRTASRKDYEEMLAASL